MKYLSHTKNSFNRLVSTFIYSSVKSYMLKQTNNTTGKLPALCIIIHMEKVREHLQFYEGKLGTKFFIHSKHVLT